MTETTSEPLAPAPPAQPRGERRAGRDRRELALWGGLIVVAIVLRMLDLGGRVFHHDESQDAYFSFLFSEDWDAYEYNPLLHGPFRFYLTAGIYEIFGASNFTARLAPATMGVIAVGLPFLLRHQLGRVAAFGAAVVLAVGPTYLYFSRFAREDIYLAAITLGMIVAIFRFLERPRALTLSVVFGLASLTFATKESGLVLCGFMALFFLGAALVQGTDGQVQRAVRAVGWEGWAYAVATLLVVYGVLFTRFFTEPYGIDAVYAGLDYWIGQQDVGRGAEPAWLYPAIIAGHEWPVLLLALVGVGASLRRPTTLRLFLVFFFAGVMFFHAWGSERFAWLVLHPLLPLILLAGVGLQVLWELRSRVARGLAAVAVVIGAAYMVGASYVANAEHGTDPRSMLVSTQTSPQVKAVIEQVIALNREFRRTHDGQPLTISVDSSSGATFPYAWYFRELDAGYPDLTAAGAAATSQILILTDEARANLLPSLAAYEGRQFDFRLWWIKKPYSSDLGDWWAWWTDREPWSSTGGMKEWLYVRRDAGDLPGKGTDSQIPTPAQPDPAPPVPE